MRIKMPSPGFCREGQTVLRNLTAGFLTGTRENKPLITPSPGFCREGQTVLRNLTAGFLTGTRENKPLITPSPGLLEIDFLCAITISSSHELCSRDEPGHVKNQSE